MADELNDIVASIVQYGIAPYGEGADSRLLCLEKSLMSLYTFILKSPNAQDESAYVEAPKASIALRENIAANFPSLGYYKDPLNILDIYNIDDMGIANAVDDLHDIIDTLLEVQWRMNNTSYENALWHLQYLFRSHLKSHLLGLLRYMHETELDQ